MFLELKICDQWIELVKIYQWPEFSGSARNRSKNCDFRVPRVVVATCDGRAELFRESEDLLLRSYFVLVRARDTSI